MSEKWPGGLILLLIASIPLYHDYRIYSVASIQSVATAVLAQDSATTDANLQCPDRSETVEYKVSGAYPEKRVGNCVSPRAAAAVGVAVETRQCIITNFYKKECLGLQAGKRIRGYCAYEKKCHATHFIDQAGKEQRVTELANLPPPFQVASTELPNVPLTRPVLPPADPSTNVNQALTNPAPPPTSAQPAAPVTPVPSAPPPPAVPTQTTVGPTPTPWSSTANLNSPATLSPSSPLASVGTTPPGYNSYASAYPQRPQNTFWGPDSGATQYVGAQQPVVQGFASSFASFFAGLLSVPSQAVTNFIQVFVPPPASPPPPSRIVLVPSTPQQRQPVVSYELTPPTERDLIRAIIAASEQQERASRTPSLGEKIIAQTSTSSPLVVTNDLEAPLDVSKPPTKVEDRQPRGGEGVIDLAAERKVDSLDRQSTSSLPRTEVIFVDVASAVEVGEAASIDSIVANFNGLWTKRVATPSQYEAALAQAQASYDAAVAHIGALQDALNAGVCDEPCMYTLASLQNEISIRRSHIAQLDDIVREDKITPRPPPPPTLAQVNRVVDSVTRTLPKATSASSLPQGPPTSVNIAAQETPQGSGEVPGEALVLRVVKSVWEFMKSLFLPQRQMIIPREPCSLFLSLVGRCP